MSDLGAVMSAGTLVPISSLPWAYLPSLVSEKQRQPCTYTAHGPCLGSREHDPRGLLGAEAQIPDGTVKEAPKHNASEHGNQNSFLGTLYSLAQRLWTSFLGHLRPQSERQGPVLELHLD